LQRRRALYEEGAIALEGLDDSTLRVEMLRENLETARQESLELHNGTRPEVLQQAAADIREIDASIQALQVDLQDCELRAPFAGSIAKRLKDEGTILSAGGPVLTLDEKGPKEAVIDLAASQEPPLTAKLSIGNEVVDGLLLAQPTRIDQSSYTHQARYSVTQGVPGQPVRLELEEFVSEPGYWLPLSSLTAAGNGLWQCYSVDENHTVPIQNVEILHREPARVLVRGTIEANDQIITEGIKGVVAGQKVALLP